MKKITSALFILISCFSVITRCSDDKTPTGRESATRLLTNHAWEIQKVTIDDVDRTSVFNRLTLKFTDSHYTTTNGHVVWPESGEWSFSDNNANTILRGDGVTLFIDEITDHSLTLSLDWQENTFNGRIHSIKGRHTFTFIR